MRPVLPLLLLASALPACSCSKSGADTPTAVTLRFTNTSDTAVYIDASDGDFGLVVTEQGSSPTAPPYLETLPVACSCLTCDTVCSAAGCPGQSCPTPVPANPQVELLPPGGAVERSWTGVYYQTSSEGCGALVGGQACLQHTNDFPDQTFTARICYALSVTGGQGADAGVPFPGILPAGDVICPQKDFQPQNGTVQLTPPPAQPCNPDAGSAACPSGQLCFAGLCSSGCPSNDFPQYGNGYYVNVSAPSGPFFTRTDTTASTTWLGTGTLTSVTYGGTTFLALVRSGSLNGSVNFTLPQIGSDCCLEAYHPGETLTVEVVESPPNSGNRGVVIRDGTGQLVQLADMATTTPVLTPALTAPFTVTPLSDPQGCASVVPGCKAIYAATRFTTPDGAAPSVNPGQVVAVTTSGGNFRVANVANIGYLATSGGTPCQGLTSLVPYTILNTRP